LPEIIVFLLHRQGPRSHGRDRRVRITGENRETKNAAEADVEPNCVDGGWGVLVDPFEETGGLGVPRRG